MVIQNFLIGLRILAITHSDDTMMAKHDEIYVSGPEPDKLEQCQLDMLEKVGFSWDDGYDCWHVFT